MPKEETIELRHVRNVIGEKEDLPSLSPRVSLASRIRALSTKFFGVPQLIHLYGALELNKTLTFDVNEDNVTSLFSDGTYLYAGLDTTPGKIIKIDLSTFTKVNTLTLNVNEDQVKSLFSDGTYLYAGLFTNPGKVVKINLATFTQDSTLNLTYTLVRSLFSDGTYLYASTEPSIGQPIARIIKINLSTFTEDSALALSANETITYSLFSDGTYLYTGSSPSAGQVGIISKIDLSTFTVVSTLSLITVNEFITSLFSDGTYLYAGSDLTGKIFKIDLLTFTIVTTLQTSSTYINSLFSDGTYLYAGTKLIVPGVITKVELSTFTEISTTTLDVSELGVKSLFSDGTYLYAGLATIPGKIVRRYIIPSNDLHQRKISLINEQTHSGTYYIYPPNAAGVTITSAAGAYTKGNYTEIIPVNTILTQYFITGITLTNLAVNTDYEIDIATGLAASEVIIATVSHMTDNTNLAHECLFPVPIKISSNTRISARSSDGTGSNTSIVKVRYKI